MTTIEQLKLVCEGGDPKQGRWLLPERPGPGDYLSSGEANALFPGAVDAYDKCHWPYDDFADSSDVKYWIHSAGFLVADNDTSGRSLWRRWSIWDGKEWHLAHHDYVPAKCRL